MHWFKTEIIIRIFWMYEHKNFCNWFKSFRCSWFLLSYSNKYGFVSVTNFLMICEKHSYLQLSINLGILSLILNLYTCAVNPFITASRGRVKKIFDCFFLVYWVHLNDIYQILGGWFTRCLETSMFYFISYMIQPYWKGAKIGYTDFPLIIIRLEMHHNGSPWR